MFAGTRHTRPIPVSRMRRHDDGFTLIELLVVIIILGVLATVAIPTYLKQRNKAGAAEAQSDLRNVAVIAETHYIDGATYEGLSVSDLYTDFDQSPNIELTVVIEEPQRYCVEALNTALGNQLFNLDNGGGQSITEGPCVE